MVSVCWLNNLTLKKKKINFLWLSDLPVCASWVCLVFMKARRGYPSLCNCSYSCAVHVHAGKQTWVFYKSSKYSTSEVLLEPPILFFEMLINIKKSLNTWDKNLLFKARKSCIQDFPSHILLRLDFNSYMCLFVSMWVHIHHSACVMSEDNCRVLVLTVLPSLRQGLFATV